MTEALRAQLRQTLEGPRTEVLARPATETLTRDQLEVAVDLLEGFADRRDLLEWQQRALVAALGRLEDEWHRSLATSPEVVSHLTGTAFLLEESPNPATCEEVRRSVLAKDLLPAFHEAHRQFRWSAGDRVAHLGDDEDDAPSEVDPSNQAHPAMRPELGELDEQQTWALSALLDGFDSAEELLVWTVRVTRASYAELDAQAAERAYFEAETREVMLAGASDTRASWAREGWAAVYLLPAFNAAARELMDHASEVVAAEEREAVTGGSLS
jgi:hypothetical protein